MSSIKEKEKLDFLHYIKIIVNLHQKKKSEKYLLSHYLPHGKLAWSKTRARKIFSSTITFCKFLL